MKKFFFIAIAGLLAFQTQAQVKFGIKAGLSSSDLVTQDFTIFNPNSFEAIKLGVRDANYGFHFGGFLQIKTGFMFLQPELLLNSSSVDYRVTDFSEGPGFTKIVRETYNTIDLPLMVGVKLGPIRLGAGPVGKFHLNHTDGLTDINGIAEDFQTIAFGYQAGFGLNLWAITLDMRFENSLSKFGNQLTVFGQNFDFDERQKQVSFSVGYMF